MSLLQNLLCQTFSSAWGEILKSLLTCKSLDDYLNWAFNQFEGSYVTMYSLFALLGEEEQHFVELDFEHERRSPMSSFQVLFSSQILSELKKTSCARSPWNCQNFQPTLLLALTGTLQLCLALCEEDMDDDVWYDDDDDDYGDDCWRWRCAT